MSIPNQDPNKATYDKNGQYRDVVHEASLDQTLPMLPKTDVKKPFTITGGGDGSRR